MENNELGLTIEQIAQSKYIIPLYQRNFAWEENEISQLLSDIYENFSNDRTSNYFVGSLVVFKRGGSEDYWEVIDGQQRLTVLSLIIKRLAEDKFTETFLSYDSRDEVSDFLNTLYSDGLKAAKSKVVVDETRNLHNAIEYIENADLTAKDVDKVTRIRDLSDEDLAAFTDYVLHNVVLVRVEMPDDTDVANYFEIMNNRGEQLQKHEILKSILMSKIKECDLRAKFALIWDACSQMDKRIQKTFEPNVRAAIFGDDYASINLDADFNIEVADETDDKIDNIISHYKLNKSTLSNAKEEEEDVTENSIIDFPNFLMHIFRRCYNSFYVEYTGCENDKIPLNDKFLLEVYNKISKYINSVEFVKQLLFYRTVFDRFIVKSAEEENNDTLNDINNSRWTLYKPSKQKDKNSVTFNNTFKDTQPQAVKALSMLQVSFRTKIYKEYLADILSWFEYGKLEMEGVAYIQRLNNLALKYYDRIEQYEWTDKDGYKRVGVSVPHYVFNFIDYLYWVAAQNKTTGIANLDRIEDFDFSYRNSVEHHLPQSYEGKYDYDTINCLGNLCLISKNLNSKLSDQHPLTKAGEKFYKKGLSPKRKIMYDITNRQKEWTEREIREHEMDIQNLLDNRTLILQDIQRTLDINNNDTLRALLCIEDIENFLESTKIDTERFHLKNKNFVQKDSFKVLIDWLKRNPEKNELNFIEEQFLTNDSILNILENKEDVGIYEETRYLLIKYPFLLEFCKEGYFEIIEEKIDNNDSLYRTVILSKTKNIHSKYYTSFKNRTTLETYTGILAYKIQEKTNEIPRIFVGSLGEGEIVIPFSANGTSINTCFNLDEVMYLYIDENFDYKLFIPNNREFQYIKDYLEDNGWELLKDNSYYYSEIGTELYDNDKNFDVKVQSALNNVIKLINSIKSFSAQ